MIVIIITQYTQERNTEHIPYYIEKHHLKINYITCYIIYHETEHLSYKNMKLKKEEEFFYPIVDNSPSFLFIFVSVP